MKRDRAALRRHYAWPIDSPTLRAMRVEIPRQRLMLAFAPKQVGTGRGWRFVLACPSQRKMVPSVAFRIGGLKRLPVPRVAADQE